MRGALSIRIMAAGGFMLAVCSATSSFGEGCDLSREATLSGKIGFLMQRGITPSMSPSSWDGTPTQWALVPSGATEPCVVHSVSGLKPVPPQCSAGRSFRATGETRLVGTTFYLIARTIECR